jgi:hypothetical protein
MFPHPGATPKPVQPSHKFKYEKLQGIQFRASPLFGWGDIIGGSARGWAYLISLGYPTTACPWDVLPVSRTARLKKKESSSYRNTYRQGGHCWLTQDHTFTLVHHFYEREKERFFRGRVCSKFSPCTSINLVRSFLRHMIKARAHKGGTRIGKTPKKLASICCP